MEEFFLELMYKDKKVKFKVLDPAAPLSVLMNNLRHSTGVDGRLIFDFPSIDSSGAPLDYFFGKQDDQTSQVRVLRPKIGRDEQTLVDYNVGNGDLLYIIPDPFPG